MSIVLITGSAGLVGSEAVSFFCNRGFKALGLDNNMRKTFFGEDASTEWNRDRLLQKYPDRYIHYDIDIRAADAVSRIFDAYGKDIDLIIHAAAQPSHDWAARDPYADFSVNANGTLVMLENARRFCPDAPFIFCSTNKVYGDRPNSLPLVELTTRWEIAREHPYYRGIGETMSIDDCRHSLFGASKAAADILVQEYGRYFGMKTAVFRAGCVTGPSHSGTRLHGFLSYLMKCTMTGEHYQVFGYKGKQVRDNIHSYDLVNAFHHFYSAPRIAEVYNIGGGRFSCCSMLEAIELCEEIADQQLDWAYEETNRIGDHIWWITDVSKFQSHYPEWHLTYNVREIITEIFAANLTRWY
jgi:CDP-paratose 2-epimerase